MKFTPFYDTLITVKLPDAEEKENVSKTGLILVTNSAKMSPMMLKVEAKGPDVPECIQEGSILMAFPGTGAETTFNDVSYHIIRSKDVICMVSEA